MDYGNHCRFTIRHFGQCHVFYAPPQCSPQENRGVKTCAKVVQDYLFYFFPMEVSNPLGYPTSRHENQWGLWGSIFGIPSARHGIQHSTSNLGALERGKQDDETTNQNMNGIYIYIYHTLICRKWCSIPCIGFLPRKTGAE